MNDDIVVPDIVQRNLPVKIVPISKAREGLFSLVDETIESHQPIAIVSKRGNAVLVSEEDWNAIQETLYLISVRGMKESIIEAAAAPDEDFISVEELKRELGRTD